MILFGFILSLFGLILDIIGVTKIFLLKVGPFKELPPLSIGWRNTMGSYNAEDKIEYLKESIDMTLTMFNEANSQNDKKANKFFFMIFIGFALQILGLILSSVHIIFPIILDYFKCTP